VRKGLHSLIDIKSEAVSGDKVTDRTKRDEGILIYPRVKDDNGDYDKGR
jgi:hypothetical protein